NGRLVARNDSPTPSDWNRKLRWARTQHDRRSDNDKMRKWDCTLPSTKFARMCCYLRKYQRCCFLSVLRLMASERHAWLTDKPITDSETESNERFCSSKFEKIPKVEVPMCLENPSLLKVARGSKRSVFRY